MAPKASKGKVSAVEKEQTLAENRLTWAGFFGSIINEEIAGNLRWLMAGPENKHGATILKPVSADPIDGDVPIFVCFLKMGMVPPLSKFLFAVM